MHRDVYQSSLAAYGSEEDKLQLEKIGQFVQVLLVYFGEMAYICIVDQRSKIFVTVPL